MYGSDEASHSYPRADADVDLEFWIYLYTYNIPSSSVLIYVRVFGGDEHDEANNGIIIIVYQNILLYEQEPQ